MQNLVERLQVFNQGRDPRLLALKYQTMRTDMFAFFRGTCHLFYEDWPANSSLNEAPPVWNCGDFHLDNLGSYKADNRLVYFNINDFDEAALAPCTWDMARLLTCLLISSHLQGLTRADALTLCNTFLENYTRTLLKNHVRTLEEEEVTGFVRDLRLQVKNRNRKAFLDARTVFDGQKRTLRTDGKHFTPAAESERTEATAAVDRWATKEPDPGFFKVLDVAHRIAGVGSLGVKRYVLLVQGKGSPDQNYLLDLKQELPSCLELFLRLPQPEWANQAERVVSIQQWTQVMPPALLAAVELGGTGYVLRELQPGEDKVQVERLAAKLERWEEVVRVIAKVLAWDQLHSGGHHGSATAPTLNDFAQTTDWRAALLDYAQYYADQVEKDYHTFCSAFDDGSFSSKDETPL